MVNTVASSLNWKIMLSYILQIQRKSRCFPLFLSMKDLKHFVEVKDVDIDI